MRSRDTIRKQVQGQLGKPEENLRKSKTQGRAKLWLLPGGTSRTFGCFLSFRHASP